MPSLASTLHAGVDRDSSSMAPGRLTRDHASPESGTGHASPEDSGAGDQPGHQFIERRRGDLEVLGQAPMAFGHKRPGADQVVGQERVCTLAHPSALGDNVTRPPAQERVVANRSARSRRPIRATR